MTDPVYFFRTAVTQSTAFVKAFEDLILISDRIGADSMLSEEAATAAGQNNRPDLTTADFDNLRAAIEAVRDLMNSSSPAVNSASVKLPFYKML